MSNYHENFTEVPQKLYKKIKAKTLLRSRRWSLQTPGRVTLTRLYNTTYYVNVEMPRNFHRSTTKASRENESGNRSKRSEIWPGRASGSRSRDVYKTRKYGSSVAMSRKFHQGTTEALQTNGSGKPIGAERDVAGKSDRRSLP